MHIVGYLYWGVALFFILSGLTIALYDVPTALGAMTGIFIIFFIPWYVVSRLIQRITTLHPATPPEEDTRS